MAEKPLMKVFFCCKRVLFEHIMILTHGYFL